MALTSFTARTTALFALLVTATTGSVLLVGGWLLAQQAVNGLDALNAAEFAEVEERLDSLPAAPDAAELDRRVRSHTEIDATLYFFQIRAADGGLLFRSANLGRAILPDDGGAPANRTAEIPGLGRVRLSEFRLGALHVQIATSIETAERLVGDYVRTSLALLGGVALVSVGLGWSFARFVLRPVRAIRETASRIGADTLGERIPVPHGRDELAALAALLNQMLGRLETSFLQVKRFTSDASHELKTPLALMRLNAEKLRPRLAADPEASEAVDDLLEDLDRLRRIVDSLLFLAKADSGGLAPLRQDIVAEDFVRTFAEDAAVLAADRGVRFTVARSDAGRAQGDPTLLWQLVLNLVSNACRAAEAGGAVTLHSQIEGAIWRLIVSDTGPGLPPDQLERVFERFVRLTPAGRTPEADGGHGLGLAICRSIAALHGGTIHAENRRDTRGLRLVVELPIAAGFRP
jgi:signal transduction histidine kinase